MYYLCIIDFLTSYTWLRKKAEYWIKRTFIGKDISCVPPDHYADRFEKFLSAAVVRGYSRDHHTVTLEDGSLKSDELKLKAVPSV